MIESGNVNRKLYKSVLLNTIECGDRINSKRYCSKRKLNIRPNGIASFGKQFGDEFGKVVVGGLVSVFESVYNPIVKCDKRKKKRNM